MSRLLMTSTPNVTTRLTDCMATATLLPHSVPYGQSLREANFISMAKKNPARGGGLLGGDFAGLGQTLDDRHSRQPRW
jgi:hypothetical protein